MRYVARWGRGITERVRAGLNEMADGAPVDGAEEIPAAGTAKLPRAARPFHRLDPRRLPPGIRYMAAGAFFFSIMSLLVKIVGQRLPSQEVVLVRALITLVLSYWGVRRAGVALSGTNRRLLILRGVLGFIALSGFYYAVVHLPLADATVIQYTNPIYATLLAVPLLGERLRFREGASILLSLLGVVFVTRPSFLFGAASAALDPRAVAFGLMGAMASGGAYVAVRRLRATEHPMVIIFYFAAISVIGSAPLGIAGALWPTPAEWWILLGVGVTTQFGQVCITHGLHLERTGRATAVGYLQIIFAATWGILFFADVPDAGTWVGALLIVGSTLALARPARTGS